MQEKILDIIQQDDTILLFFNEGTDLQAIVDKQKKLEEEGEEKELNYYEIGIKNFSFLGKEYPCIYLRFDRETDFAISEKRRLGF